jgi:uncharacterized damage-inducible protein DinB
MNKSQLVEDYLQGIETLRKAVAGLTPEQAKARPVSGKWSTLEVVCHLADFEPIYADRIKRILVEDRPILMGADEKRLAGLNYHDRDLQEELALIQSVRKQLARILARQPESAFQRIGVYRYEGKDEERTVERFVTLITGHIPHHVKFVHDKRKALGLA